MRIGVPREVKNSEFRVALTPAGVHELTAHGHHVSVEAGVGGGSSISDDEYRAAGAIVLDDAAVMSLLQKEIKNRREALEEAKKANRPDLASANEAEIAILETFLPAAMPAEELRALVKAAIAETGAAVPSDMGKVMKAVMPKVAGRAPNSDVSAMVKELLQ